MNKKEEKQERWYTIQDHEGMPWYYYPTLVFMIIFSTLGIISKDSKWQ
jgi:hypothetical protein